MFSRESKIYELCEHSYSHDILKECLYFKGKNYLWADKPINARKPVFALDKLIGSAFVDDLLEIANTVPVQKAFRGDSSKRRAWWKEAVIYHIYSPSFMDSDHDGIGDFGGIMRRLPYLESLGINTLLLWPVIQSDKLDVRGVIDYTQVMAELGGFDAFEELLEAAHARGIRLLMGVDISATSPQHEWYKRALEEDGGVFEDYYIFEKGSPDAPPNSWQNFAGGAAWHWCAEKQAWNLRVTGEDLADLNWKNPHMRAEVIDALKLWVKRGVDGFVFPGVNCLAKGDLGEDFGITKFTTGINGMGKYLYSAELHDYLKEIRSALSEGLSEKNIPFLGGEIIGIGSSVAKSICGKGRGELDMIMDVRHLGRSNLPHSEGENVDLAVLKRYYTIWMREFADERWLPLFLEDETSARIISRLSENMVYKNMLAKQLALMLFTLKGTPIMYQAGELGMLNNHYLNIDEISDEATHALYEKLLKNYTEQEALEIAVQNSPENAKTPMPWNTGVNAGFTGADPWKKPLDGYENLNTALQINDKNSVWNFYRRLIKLRMDNRSLVYGSFRLTHEKSQNVFCYVRETETEKWYIEMNISQRELIRPRMPFKGLQLMLSNYGTAAKSLRPYEANVYAQVY